MKLPKKSSDRLVLIIAVAAVLLLLLVVILFPSLLRAALITLVVLALGFLGVYLFQQRKKKQKSKQFEERIAAKEGIADRRKEWAEWSSMLEERGVDRYELPFYLIVGEPQSGKSVLLKHSDLYFPFGQDRVSGAGGTRGCDWWVTDEAILLDIAGRLFTHEGGVADKLEWEAFLQLLHDYRPMCPANGVLLVVPCDALLEDDDATAADKANKIQAAMLTLSEKLEATLPVYLVLTKADKVFGFAESVHRLGAEERAQMFGWSRPAEADGAAFSLEEAQEGFSVLVDRARLLRERMIATARIPEALPEIDRFYAFPDELAAVFPALKTYLQRVFAESSLVESTSFRGIYLTSGLQAGVPIAKVCGELLSGDRESDNRGLESLFSHQRAYFIRDLIKDRVIEERGLVRPTEGRVKAAKQKTIVGYGAAALIAVGSLVGGAFHLMGKRPEEVLARDNRALELVGKVTAESSIPEILRALREIQVAKDQDRGEVMQDSFSTLADDYGDLYRVLVAERLLPAVRSRCEAFLSEAVGRGASSTPESYSELTQWMALASSLSSSEGANFADKNVVEAAQGVLSSAGATSSRSFRLEHALSDDSLAGRDEFLRSDATEDVDYSEIVHGVLELGFEALDPRNQWFVHGELGLMCAASAALDAMKVIDRTTVDSTDSAEALLRACDTYMHAVPKVNALAERLPSGPTQGAEVRANQVVTEIAELSEAFEALLSHLSDSTAEFDRWNSKKQKLGNDVFHADFGWMGDDIKEIRALFVSGGVIGDFVQGFLSDAGQSETAKIEAKTVTRVFATDNQDGAERLAACMRAPHLDSKLKDLERLFGNPPNKWTRLDDEKLRAVVTLMPGRYEAWADVRAESDAGSSPEEPAPECLRCCFAVLQGLEGRKVLRTRDGKMPAGWVHLQGLLLERLVEIGRIRVATNSEDEPMSWDLFLALQRIGLSDIDDSNIPAALITEANELRWRLLEPTEARLLESWQEAEQSVEGFEALWSEVRDHVMKAHSARDGSEIDEDRIGDAHLSFLLAVDGILQDRLTEYVDTMEDFWRDPDGGTPLGELSASGILSVLSGRLESESSKSAIKRFGDLNAIPSFTDLVYDHDHPIFSRAELEGSSQLLDRAVTIAKTARNAQFSGYANSLGLSSALRRLGALLEDDSADGWTNRAEAATDSWWKRELPNLANWKRGEPAVAADFYLAEGVQALREAMRADVRGRYITRFKSLLEGGEGETLRDAIYGRSDQTDSGARGDVLSAWDAILSDQRDSLVRLRKNLRMDPNPEEGEESLRPAVEALSRKSDRELWAFEEFLFEFRALLENGEPIEVDFLPNLDVPSDELEGVWQFRNSAHCYFTKQGDDKAFAISFGGGRWPEIAEDARTIWSFRNRARSSFWILWSKANLGLGEGVSIDTERELRAREARFVEVGVFAPFVLAWRGENSDDGEDAWVLRGQNVQRLNAQEQAEEMRARLRMRFFVKDQRRSLPERPEDPFN